MANREEQIQPIRQSIVVECPIEDAFDLFTNRIAEWWPLASHSLSGEDAASCAMEPRAGGRLYERSRSGEEREWGTVTHWDPPRHVAFTWHPGARPDDEQTVELNFSVEAIGTRITVIHTGWERTGIEASAHAECSRLWSTALELCFAPFVMEQIAVAV